MRPKSAPCLSTCVEVPQMTSSTSSVAKWLRSASAFSTAAAKCCGCRCASAPLPALPMPRGVRHASMIKASGMNFPRDWCGIIVRMAVTVNEAVLSRHSCRAFTAQAVDAGVIRKLLTAACFAPSGGNLQPWLVHVVSGDAMARFRAQLTPKFLATPFGGTPEYHVYPPELKEPYRSRRHKNGEDLYELIGVARGDRPARHRQFAR